MRRTACETAGWVKYNFAAARTKLPSSATATNTRYSERSARIFLPPISGTQGNARQI